MDSSRAAASKTGETLRSPASIGLLALGIVFGSPWLQIAGLAGLLWSLFKKSFYPWAIAEKLRTARHALALSRRQAIMVRAEIIEMLNDEIPRPHFPALIEIQKNLRWIGEELEGIQRLLASPLPWIWERRKIEHDLDRHWLFMQDLNEAIAKFHVEALMALSPKTIATHIDHLEKTLHQEKIGRPDTRRAA